MRYILFSLFVAFIVWCNYCPNHNYNQQWYHFGHSVDSKYDSICNNCNTKISINY